VAGAARLGLCFLCFLTYGKAATQVQDNHLLSLLPDPSGLRGWAVDGDHQLFEGEDLFIYIDGGAEIYLEYGFARVIVQDYRNDAGSRLSLEIFEMQSPESAYGMFTFKRRPRGEPLALGDDGQLADYYLNFRRGRFLATITSLDQVEAAREGLLAIARAVDSHIQDTSARPSLVDVLPEEDLLGQSIKFFRGPIGVSNSEPLLAEVAAGMENGVRGDYGSGSTILVFSYGREDLAQKKWAGASFSDKRKWEDFTVRGPAASARDGKGRSVFALLEGRHILFVMAKTDLPRARAQLDRVAGKLRALPPER
jgi:hypothetical protein